MPGRILSGVNISVDWIEYCLTSHQTHYRSCRGLVFIFYPPCFYGSNDPTDSVKALKEDSVVRIRLQSHQVHPIMLTII